MTMATMLEPGQQRRRERLAVVGLGGIGGVVAGSLCHAGRHDVIGCARRPLDRLTVERPDGTFSVPLRCLDDPSLAAPVDWVILATKAHETVSAAPWLSRLCGRDTRVAVLQNGIRHVERVGPLVGAARVVPTVVYYNGERISPDRVRLRHAGPYDLAMADDADGRALETLLEGSTLRLLVTPEFDTLAWRKLLLNVTANPITALTLQRQAVLRRSDVKALCLAVLNEAVAVARAEGARFRGRRGRAGVFVSDELSARSRDLDVLRPARRPGVRSGRPDRLGGRGRRAPRRADAAQSRVPGVVARHQRRGGDRLTVRRLTASPNANGSAAAPAAPAPQKSFSRRSM